MGKRVKTVYTKRKFINPDKYSNSFINANLDLENIPRGKSKEPNWVIGGSITLADCTRNISFYMDGWNKSEANKNLKKLDNIIEILQEYRDNYEEQIVEVYGD